MAHEHKIKTIKRNDREEHLTALISQLAQYEQFSLNSWNAFAKEINVPMEMYVALQSGRTELLRLSKPRAFTEEESKALLDCVGTMIHTNALLQQHAQLLAKMVSHWSGAFNHLRSLGQRIELFGNFKSSIEEKDGEGAVQE